MKIGYASMFNAISELPGASAAIFHKLANLRTMFGYINTEFVV